MANEPTSALDRIKQLDQERARLLEEAKREAMDRATQAVADLNALGFNYRLTEVDDDTSTSARPSDEGSKRVRRMVKPGTACPVCKFATEPPHDGRAHKKHPEPFRDEELAERGMRRI